MGTGDGMAPRLEPDRPPGSPAGSPGRGARGRRGAAAHAFRRALVRQPRRGRLVAGVRAGRRPPRVAERRRPVGRHARPRRATGPPAAADGPDARGRRHPGLASRRGTGMSHDLVLRLAGYFGAEPTRPAILARLALGHPGPRDPYLAAELRMRLAAEMRPDGSVGGASLPTMWRGAGVARFRGPRGRRG